MPIDPRIAMSYQSNIEPVQNALMRASQLAGQRQAQQMNALQMQDYQRRAQAAMMAEQQAAAQKQEMDGYLSSLSGRMGPPQPFNAAEAIQRTGSIDMAKKLQEMMQPGAGEAFTLAPGGMRYGPDGKLIASAPFKPEAPALPSAAQEYEYAKQQGYKGLFMDWKAAQKPAGVSVNNYGSPVAGIGPDGRPAFFQTSKAGGAPAMVPGVRPPLSAAEERQAADKATKEKQGQQVASIIDSARAILKSGSPTASGIGTMVDAGARVFGQTTPGAQSSAQLQALGGWFVSNVPRMEGPQSNFDVQNYMTMAGKIGDSTVPVKERLAALEVVEQLQRKYADINGTPLPAPASGANGPAAGTVVDGYRFKGGDPSKQENWERAK